MIELPESYTLASQIDSTLRGKTVKNIVVGASPHGFAWYNGDSDMYNAILSGRELTAATPGTGYTCGGNTEIIFGDALLVMSTPIKYHEPGAKLPKKYQLLIEFDDSSHISCTVQMWGAMLCYETGDPALAERYAAHHLPSPLEDGFDDKYFGALRAGVPGNMSAKAFLATDQRIPGFGNGVLQDVLINAQLHPKRTMESVSDDELEALYKSVKHTLKDMAESGGRDTEKDIYGRPGGYKTILSKNTLGFPCRICGGDLVRQTYLGGNIYFCKDCQPL